MDWLVLDRYVAPAEQPQVLADFFALPEGTLQAGQAWSSAEGQPAVWRRMRAPGDTFPVRSMLGREYSGKCGFLACELQSEDAGDAEFRLQSGLDVTLWLNGRELKRGGGAASRAVRRAEHLEHARVDGPIAGRHESPAGAGGSIGSRPRLCFARVTAAARRPHRKGAGCARQTDSPRRNHRRVSRRAGNRTDRD